MTSKVVPYLVEVTAALQPECHPERSAVTPRGVEGPFVVGMTNYWPLLGYGSYPSWLRHRITRDNVKLRLYGYRWPIRDRTETPFIKTVTTDKNGSFDFGGVPVGQYTLVIDWPVADGNSFDLEIKNSIAETSSVTVDVSPVDPDCKGGHEFIVP
jgi:hypothetical protein